MKEKEMPLHIPALDKNSESITVESFNQFGNRKESGCITYVAKLDDYRDYLRAFYNLSLVGKIRVNVHYIRGSEFVTLLIDYSNKRDEKTIFDFRIHDGQVIPAFESSIEESTENSIIDYKVGHQLPQHHKHHKQGNETMEKVIITVKKNKVLKIENNNETENFRKVGLSVGDIIPIQLKALMLMNPNRFEIKICR